jgi:hypothetical protein
MASDKAEECKALIDFLLGLVASGKLKYEYGQKFYFSMIQVLVLELSKLPFWSIEMITICFRSHAS